MVVEAKFTYNGSFTSIQCSKSDTMKDIIDKYISKTELDINKIYFLYGGSIINKELSVNDLTKGNENTINILVSEIEEEKKPEKKELKKSNVIVCSICKEICKLAIEDYQIKLYGCENGHTIKDISVNDLSKTQYIDESKIICDICKSANKKEQYNKLFHYCNECKQKICPLCKSKHDKSHNIIDYDKRNYMCYKHNEKFISYCNDCNKNLCYNCETGHNKDHIRVSFQDFNINKDNLSQIIKGYQGMVTKVNEKIEAIITNLNELKKNIANYNDIFYNVLNNFEQENRNFYILNNINALFDNSIIRDLGKISDNKKDSICSDFKILMRMYTKMNINKVSNELKKNQNEFELEEFKTVKYLNLQEAKLLNIYGENSICTIFNKENKKNLGLGFLIQINPFSKLPFERALFTCNHIVPEEFFKNNEYLYFVHKNTNKKIYIKECQIFSKNAKYEDLRKDYDKRKIFVNKELDYTLIEILDSDDIIDKKYELFKIGSLNQNYLSDIAVLHYPNKKGLSFSLGKFTKKNDNSLVHNCFTSPNSEGAPIINLNNNQYIIGIHSKNIGNLGLGNSMDMIFCDIKNNLIKCFNKENSLQNNFLKLTIHKDFITNLILLDENTLCSCSIDGNVIFLNAKNFNILGIIKENIGIIYIEKLSDNNIILCCEDGSLRIYKEKEENSLNKISDITKFIAVGGILLFAPKLTPVAIQLLLENKENKNNQKIYISKKYELLEIIKGHQESVCKVIEISKNMIISTGLDTKMRVWQKKDSNFTCIKSLTVNDELGSSTNILKINRNEIVSAATNANYIIFWNINTLKEYKKISNIVCNWNRNSMKMINNNTLFIGGDNYNGIYLIDVVNYQLTSRINIEKVASVSSIITLNNGNILIGCKKEKKAGEEDISYTYSLIEYKYNSKKKILNRVKSNMDAHNNIITGLIKLNNNEIVSCGLDKTIKFWI